MSKTRPVLFLGGPLHGQVLPIPWRSQVWMVPPEMPSLADMDPREPPDTGRALEPVEYLVEKVATRDPMTAGWVAVQEKDRHDAIARWAREIGIHLHSNGTPLLY